MMRGCGKTALLLMAGIFTFMAVPAVILLIAGLLTGGHVLSFLIASVMLLLPAIVFFVLGLRQPKERPLRMDKTVERHVLHAAALNNGELTASQLALNSQLRLDQCQQVLEEFEAMGVARGHVDENGQMRYVFPDFQDSEITEDDDFMRRLEESDPRSVLDFDLSEKSEESVPVEAKHRHKSDDS